MNQNPPSIDCATSLTLNSKSLIGWPAANGNDPVGLLLAFLARPGNWLGDAGRCWEMCAARPSWPSAHRQAVPVSEASDLQLYLLPGRELPNLGSSWVSGWHWLALAGRCRAFSGLIWKPCWFKRRLLMLKVTFSWKLLYTEITWAKR